MGIFKSVLLVNDVGHLVNLYVRGLITSSRKVIYTGNLLHEAQDNVDFVNKLYSDGYVNSFLYRQDYNSVKLQSYPSTRLEQDVYYLIRKAFNEDRINFCYIDNFVCVSEFGIQDKFLKANCLKGTNESIHKFFVSRSENTINMLYNKLIFDSNLNEHTLRKKLDSCLLLDRIHYLCGYDDILTCEYDKSCPSRIYKLKDIIEINL